MKKMMLTILLALPLLSGAASALDHEAGLRLLAVDPAGAFGDAVDDLGGGLEAHWGVRPSPAWTVGLLANYMIYGEEKTRYELPLVEDFDLTTNNNLAGAFLFAQWRPLRGALQPYAEARAGWSYIWTESKLEDEDWWDDDEVARETNYDDFAFAWGGAGGLLIRLSGGNKSEGKPGVLLDLKVSHMQGGEAEYLTEGDIEIVDNAPVYHPSKTETDRTTYQLGVVLTF